MHLYSRLGLQVGADGRVKTSRQRMLEKRKADHDAFPIDMKAPREHKAGIEALPFYGGVAFV